MSARNITANSQLPSPIRVGIMGAAGYTGGELIRLLLNHPAAKLVFAHSQSQAGKLLSQVHDGLQGETDLRFCADIPLNNINILFLCLGHGKSKAFLSKNELPKNLKVIDLTQDFRLRGNHDFIYGLPEMNREQIKTACLVANPGCFATCIQLGLIPLAQAGLLCQDICVNAITGSTGAGCQPTTTTHFSWRNNNLSLYKLFTHQHLHEIVQTLNELRPTTAPHVIDTLSEPQDTVGITVDFIPYRGDFPRGIFCTALIRLPKAMTSQELNQLYTHYYQGSPFTLLSEKEISLKEVVNTNRALINIHVFGQKAVVSIAIDNLLKGAVGQAIQNMNLMFGLDESMGLKLKASAF